MMECTLDQDFVRSLTIPPRPEIVAVLFEEMSRDVPDLRRISKSISADVGLSAAMLKVVNSPAFNLVQKARSITQAVELLGMRNVSGIATGLVIRHALAGGEKDAAMIRFWDTAEKTALICAISRNPCAAFRATRPTPSTCSHDCGIPLLMRRYPQYKETLARANRSGDRSFAQVEEEDVGTHHGAVGYFRARSWSLPDTMCQAILSHHDLGMYDDPEVADAVRNFVGIGHIAEHVE